MQTHTHIHMLRTKSISRNQAHASRGCVPGLKRCEIEMGGQSLPPFSQFSPILQNILDFKNNERVVSGKVSKP